MATANQLLEAVYRHPLEDNHRLAYAAFLCEQGDPLGEFIQLQMARSRGGRGTRQREQWLLAAAGDGWWANHPSWFGRRGELFPLGATDRGFPSVFDCRWPVEQPALGKQLRGVGQLVGAMGWSTVTSLNLHGDMAPELAAPLLLGSPLMSLRALEAVPTTALSAVGHAPLPVETLEVVAKNDERLPVVTGFPSLRQLTLQQRSTFSGALRCVEASGLLERIETLTLQGVSSELVLLDALEAFASMPATLTKLTVNQFGGRFTELSGDHASPELRLRIDAFRAEKLAAVLKRLPRSALKSVRLDFARGGASEKKLMTQHARRLENAIEKWNELTTAPEPALSSAGDATSRTFVAAHQLGVHHPRWSSAPHARGSDGQPMRDPVVDREARPNDSTQRAVAARVADLSCHRRNDGSAVDCLGIHRRQRGTASL